MNTLPAPGHRNAIHRVRNLLPRLLPLAAVSSLALPALGYGPQNPERELNFLEGQVTVGSNLATIDLPAEWSYLEAGDARYVVEEYWGNPPDPSVIGLVVPPEANSGDGASWAIIVSYDESGYVDDSEAAGLDYDDLLEEMQSGSAEGNAERRAAGYGAVHLLGWAEKPHYDAAGKKLYWAENLRFEGEPGSTLNYDVRILGRRGVLLMNAVADLDHLAEVAQAAKMVLAVTEFTPGNRYEDFDPSYDKVAAYGIGGLIAGKVLLKAGLFKWLLLLLAKSWKVILVGVALISGGVAKILGGRSKAGSTALRRAPMSGAQRPAGGPAQVPAPAQARWTSSGPAKGDGGPVPTPPGTTAAPPPPLTQKPRAGQPGGVGGQGPGKRF